MRQWFQRLSIPDKTRLALQPLKNQLQKTPERILRGEIRNACPPPEYFGWRVYPFARLYE